MAGNAQHAEDSLILTITAAEFNAGADAVFQELGEAVHPNSCRRVLAGKSLRKVAILRLQIVAAVRNWLGVETQTISDAFVRVDQDGRASIKDVLRDVPCKIFVSYTFRWRLRRLSLQAQQMRPF